MKRRNERDCDACGLDSASLLGLTLVVGLDAQNPDRSKPPALGPAPSVKLPAIQKTKLTNGLPVWLVEHHEVPLAQVNLIVRSGSAADPIGKYGIGNLTAAMLDEGAGSRSALDLADAIDFLGANICDDEHVRSVGDSLVGAGRAARTRRCR